MAVFAEPNTRSAGWAAIVGGFLWIILWDFSSEATGQGSFMAGGVWRLMLNLPILFMMAAQLGQRGRFGLRTGPVTVAGFWIVFYSTAAVLVGNLVQYGIDRLPWDRLAAPIDPPNWGVVVMGLGITVHPIGLTLAGAATGQGFSELTRTTLLAFGLGLFAALTAGLAMAVMSTPPDWALHGILFMFGGGWIILGLTFIGEAPRGRVG